jgi:hypothetical protein
MAIVRPVQSILAAAAFAATSLTLVGCPSITGPEAPKEVTVTSKQQTVQDG